MNDEARSTRELIWHEVAERNPEEVRLSVWRSTEVIGRIPDAEWRTMHAGTCGLCGREPARLYVTGWRCPECAP